MYFHTAEVHQLLCHTRLKTKPGQKQLFKTWGTLQHLGVGAYHTRRPPSQPATLCRPQPGPTHQRAQQAALPLSTSDPFRNSVSQQNPPAISSAQSQTAPAAPAAAVQCSRSQPQAVEIRAVTSTHGVVPPEVAGAAAALWQLQELILLFLPRLLFHPMFLRLELLLLRWRLLLCSAFTPSLK